VSRCAGMNPASEMMRRSSFSLVRFFYTSGEHNVFLDQNAADIVSAELQSDLANLDAGRQPAGLNVVDVVEVEPADGQRFQIIDCRRFLHFFPRAVFSAANIHGMKAVNPPVSS